MTLVSNFLLLCPDSLNSLIDFHSMAIFIIPLTLSFLKNGLFISLNKNTRYHPGPFHNRCYTSAYSHFGTQYQRGPPGTIVAYPVHGGTGLVPGYIFFEPLIYQYLAYWSKVVPGILNIFNICMDSLSTLSNLCRFPVIQIIHK